MSKVVSYEGLKALCQGAAIEGRMRGPITRGCVRKKVPSAPIPLILGIEIHRTMFAFTSTNLANTHNGD